jgi:hypothetical protein
MIAAPAELLDSASIRTSSPALRRRAEEMGYLFFRGLIPVEPVRALRATVLSLCDRRGWLLPGWSIDAALVPSDGRVGDPASPEMIAFLAEVLVRVEFLALGGHPSIGQIFDRLFDAPVESRCGDLCRLVPPNAPERTTLPHQDGHFVHRADLWTVWLPLGDCPGSLGGLAIAPGSHRQGPLAHGTDGVVSWPAGVEPTWATTDYRAGDAVMFSGLTVHGACPNRTERELRISVDYRYRPGRVPSPRGEVLT